MLILNFVLCLKMKNELYLIQDGELKRKENTVYFVNENTKRALPINRINSIFAYGSLSISSGIILYLGKKGIPVHFFDYYGWYKSTLYPRETLISGDMIVKQSSHYLDNEKRILLAKKFVEGGYKNILRNLKYYSNKENNLNESVLKIDSLKSRFKDADSIERLMREEGHMREIYYHAWDSIFPDEFNINKRERQPPTNKMNSLISFGNSLVYTQVLSEIYHTQVNPTISFLHEPFERRFSLSLDISEIFKPFLTDRIIFKLVNQNMLNDNCFESKYNGILLSDKGKKIFLNEWDSKLNRTIKHRSLGRNVSYKRLIRLEVYKLAKHFLGTEEYSPFVIWW